MGKLRKGEAADTVFFIEKASDFSYIGHQPGKMTNFFKNFQKDMNKALLESDVNCLARDVFMNVIHRMTERLPSFCWYSDEDGVQKFYEVQHTKIRLIKHSWKILCLLED